MFFKALFAVFGTGWVEAAVAPKQGGNHCLVKAN